VVSDVSMSYETAKGGGIGFTGLLFLLFLGLKLGGAIDWSWWWIFAPLWGPVVIFILFLLFTALFVWRRY